MDGLKPAVRLMVPIQMPEDLYKAYQLALLHEELGDGNTQLNTPAPGRRSYGPAVAHHVPARHVDREAPMHQKHPVTEDKWTALQNYRKAKGVCFTCGERWGKEHKCLGTVQ
jgi:hypothetical protein